MHKKSFSLAQSLQEIIPKQRIKSKPIDLHAFARDAGFYRLVPQSVVQATNTKEISSLFKFATLHGRSIVFRAGGTSLSGQSISDDILVEVKNGWKGIDVLGEGAAIKMGAGVIGSRANQALTAYNTRIGPDPGSIKAAFISGIVANNASGIGSGILHNSYNTLMSMEIVLTNGLVLNSANADANQHLLDGAPELYMGLLQIRKEILASKKLTQRIRHKYRLKNTSGYSLNSFVDYETPIEILTHLMVGSEGTLGFISEVILATLPIAEHKATALILFKNLIIAANYVPILGDLGPSALEIMDDSALRALQRIPGLPEVIYGEILDETAALLLEFESENIALVNDFIKEVENTILSEDLLQPLSFTKNAEDRENLWSVRRELGPLHAANRPQGTTVLSEDVCFETKDLASAIKDLQKLFKVYGYLDAIIFGHSREGNLHFKLSIYFDRVGAVENYGSFMEDLVDLVVEKYDGSLKAEHGTGRNVAPFIEKEWGPEAFAIMSRIKRLFDPDNILNPNVIISKEHDIHLQNIKSIPAVDPLIDPCIECGMCEKWCPSADLTLSPRQRIAVLRELKILEKGDHAEKSIAKDIQVAFEYSGVDTCAADGLCSIGCPVDINTGDLMKQFRIQRWGGFSISIGNFLQKNYGQVLKVTRGMLILIRPLIGLLKYSWLQKKLDTLPRYTNHHIPTLSPHISRASSGLPTIIQSQNPELKVVYFPSCLNRLFGDPKSIEPGQGSVPETFLHILDVAGIQAVYPQNIDDLCCGLTFSSKGLDEAALQSAIQATEMLWLASEAGKIPIVIDTSPCSYHMKYYDKILQGEHLKRWRNLIILDVSEYLNDYVLPRVELSPVKGKAVLHSTCSTIKMGLEPKMLQVARSCSEEAVYPEDTGCCGFAGDRGFFYPELTASATKVESASIDTFSQVEGHYSTSRMCEIGMSQATGKKYSAIIYLVDSAIKRKYSG
jgi:D-lactate dehydrogenase